MAEKIAYKSQEASLNKTISRLESIIHKLQAEIDSLKTRVTTLESS
tara:strand:- start:9226 stop:9363 length:138 start_codon:yes stop_codon:yes gene_type:complete